jgi:hypothetical protein
VSVTSFISIRPLLTFLSKPAKYSGTSLAMVHRELLLIRKDQQPDETNILRLQLNEASVQRSGVCHNACLFGGSAGAGKESEV